MLVGTDSHMVKVAFQQLLQTFYLSARLSLELKFVKCTVGALVALVEGFLVSGGDGCLV